MGQRTCPRVLYYYNGRLDRRHRPTFNRFARKRLSHSTATLHVAALDCPDEFALIEKGLRGAEGLAGFRPQYLDRQLRIEYDPGKTSAERIAARLSEIGFPAQVVDRGVAPERRGLSTARALTLIGGAVLGVAMAVRLASGPSATASTLASLAAVVAGAPVARAAWRAIRLRALDMHVLMTIAAVGAIATGEAFEAGTAMFLFSVSLWLESYSLNRARRAVRSLAAFSSIVAHRASGNELIDVDPAALTVGDVVLVKPGERVPIDGVIVEGESSLNEAAITGESAPRDKAPGDTVYAGALNGEAALRIEATRTAETSALAQIARLVEQAQAARSPTERFVDQFARRYTPAVIALAVLIAVAPPTLAWMNAAEWAAAASPLDWLHRGLVLLVIACPCALVISTPVTIVCGLRAAARRGMLVKGGEFLELAGKVDAVAFDKTGTLTRGEPRVTSVVAAAGVDENEVLSIAAALEAQSEHPLARAILDEARRRGIVAASATDVAAQRGFGVAGTIDGAAYRVGSPRMFNGHAALKLAIESLLEQSANLESAGTTAIVGADDRLLGAILLADEPRDDARDSIASLRSLGIKRIAMLTGDARPVAERIGRGLGIGDVFAELLPADKVATVEKLASQQTCLAMVGDGVNDAPALARAPLGIALGSAASDTALETADVAIMPAEVNRVPELLRLGRRTRRILWQNIGASLAIKAIVLASAAAGIATMWMAVAADVGASLLVIANGMRVLRDARGDM